MAQNQRTFFVGGIIFGITLYGIYRYDLFVAMLGAISHSVLPKANALANSNNEWF